MYLDEMGRPLYDAPRESWTKAASLTAALLGLAAALAVGAAAFWGVRAYLESEREQRRGLAYQTLTSKIEALRQNRDIFTLHRLLEHKNPKVQKLIEGKLQDYEDELLKLEKAQEQLKEAVEAQGIKRERWARQAAGTARTVWVLLLGVILAAASVQGKKKLWWLMALVLAAGGLASFLGGVLLWF